MRQAMHESWLTHTEPLPIEEVPERMTAAVIDAVGGTEQLHLAEVDTPRQVNSEFIVRVVGNDG